MASSRLSVFCRSAVDGAPCEDRAGGLCDASRTIAWVIDGSTGISDHPTIPGAETDAAWFAEKLSASFEHHLGRGTLQRSLRHHLGTAVNSVADAYENSMLGRLPGAELVPSASVVALRASRPNSAWEVQVARLGDCVCIVRDMQGTRIFPSTLAEDFDQEFELICATNDARSGLQQALIQRRLSANTKDGYRIVSAKRDTGFAASEVTFQIAHPATFLVASDGMCRIVQKYGAYTFDELLDVVARRGIEEVYRELRGFEASDPDCKRFPRVKVHDDASAVFGVIE
jgi:hypothetical protein